MPKYVIERQYLLPVYQRLVIEADTVEEACEKAIDHDAWKDAVEDGDGARATSINAVKCIPANVNVPDLDFNPEDPTRIEAKLVELGRDGDAFGFESIQQYSRGDDQWPGDIAAWREVGGSHISVVTMGANLTTVDGHIEAIKRWRDVYNSVR